VRDEKVIRGEREMIGRKRKRKRKEKEEKKSKRLNAC
jgi:hypothetical protein